MACSGRYAEAWQFAAFWCVSGILKGVDNSGLVFPQASLTDTQIDFVRLGVHANVGMVCYNLTRSTSGPVTAVTANTLTVSGVTWGTGDQYRIALLEGTEIATIELYLDIAASDIHAAMAASGACDCTLASWAEAYLQKLNVIDAAIYHQCPCGKPDVSDEMRRAHLEWMNVQLDNIRTGKVELCTGETGSEFPAIAWAEQSSTEFAAAQIVYNDSLKDQA